MAVGGMNAPGCIFSAPTINDREGIGGEEIGGEGIGGKGREGKGKGRGRVVTWLLWGWTPLAVFLTPPSLTIAFATYIVSCLVSSTAALCRIFMPPKAPFSVTP